MNDLGVHSALFALIGLGIVAMAAFYTESDNAAAFRGLPRRFGMFCLGCGILALLLIVAERTVASIH